MTRIRHRAAAEPAGESKLRSSKVLSVLILHDQQAVAEICQDVVESLNYRAFFARSSAQAISVMGAHQVDLVIADLSVLLREGKGIVAELKRRNPQLQIGLIVPGGSINDVVQVMSLEAADYIVKPFAPAELRSFIERLAAGCVTTKKKPSSDVPESSRLLEEACTGSKKMQQVLRVIRKVSLSRCSVLILGESGTGKELAARCIHQIGPWSDKPFLPIDCSALAPTLIESELFGHVRGAFTGAAESKQGLLQAAKGGTLFFDEIGELPLELQGRLLRAIQEREFRPLGSTRSIPFEGRVIAATNRDLKAAVKQGSFRRDLYFRLNVVSITLPPLRERRETIPILARQILRRISDRRDRYRSAVPWVLSPEVIERFLVYEWPGNVRELENCLERAAALSSGPVIRVADLPSGLQSLSSAVSVQGPRSIIPMEEMERQAIERAMEAAGSDKALAARLLGIGKSTLYRKLAKYKKEGK